LDDPVTASNFWFGPQERPLFARLRLPEGGLARGGVVLCPPFGFESWRAGRAYGVLSGQLAAEGFAVLHFDYDGTGDSSGTDDGPERVEAWQHSITEAVATMRQSGARHVSLVGLRLGATLAASASAACQPDALVLWDPCESGRSYLREQAVLRAVYEQSPLGPTVPTLSPTGAQKGPTAVETIGTTYGPETAQALSGLRVGPIPAALDGNVLAFLRPGSPPRKDFLEHLSQVHAELVDAEGQDRVLDIQYPDLCVPLGTLASIVNWLSQRAGQETSAINLVGHQTTVIPTADDGAVVEEVKQLGPNGLFGILARPMGQSRGPTVILLNAGHIDHCGPGRLWVELARSWAAAGVPVLRFDMSGRGDSPARPGQNLDIVYSPEALEDLADVVKAVSPESPSGAVLMGLCSGGFHAVFAGAELGVGGVLAVNPAFSGRLRGTQVVEQTPGRESSPWASISTKRRALAVARRVISNADDLFGGLTRRLPDGVRWWWIKRLSHAPRPGKLLESLARQGADAFVICGVKEGKVVSGGEESVLRRLEKTGNFHMSVLPGIDHSLFTQAARDQVRPLLTEHVIARFVQPSAPATTATGRERDR
jgi:pimeloyl-ACP methyl ester carboxylesterase